MHTLYNYWFSYENGKEKLFADLFRRMQIQNEENKNDQIHRSWTKIKVRVRRIICHWIRVKVWHWMIVILFQTTNFERVENLVVILLTLNGLKTRVVILLLIVEQSRFFDTLLNPPYLCLSIKIFSCLCSYFWGDNFECYGCSCILKKFLVTDQLDLGKTKIHSQFLIFRLHYWCNKKL